MLIIPSRYKSLVFLRPIAWPEVFNTWREGEAEQDSWRQHWEERGFSSWNDWRSAYAAPLEPEKLDWSLYKINAPIADAPRLFGVPSQAWINNAYAGETTKLLGDILSLPIVTENPKISEIRNDFPQNTMLTGLVADDKIILIEGMHRALALASWDRSRSLPLDSEISIALAGWTKPIPQIGGNHKK